MEFIRTEIPDVIILKPKVFGDARGFFMETFREQEFIDFGIQVNFVQDNHSGSNRGVLRGLHYQIKQPQGKLVRVVKGVVFDVAVDIRRSSPTFGKWVGCTLSEENKLQVWVPPGFAHGYYVLSEWAEFCYRTTDYYAPQWERTLLWSDERIAITWPVIEGTTPLVSDKDKRGKTFLEAEIYE